MEIVLFWVSKYCTLSIVYDLGNKGLLPVTQVPSEEFDYFGLYLHDIVYSIDLWDNYS